MWWVGFERTDQVDWQFFEFLLYLCIPIGLFLLSYLVVPDLDEPEQIDLRTSFHDNRLWLYGLPTAPSRPIGMHWCAACSLR